MRYPLESPPNHAVAVEEAHESTAGPTQSQGTQNTPVVVGNDPASAKRSKPIYSIAYSSPSSPMGPGVRGFGSSVSSRGSSLGLFASVNSTSDTPNAKRPRQSLLPLAERIQLRQQQQQEQQQTKPRAAPRDPSLQNPISIPRLSTTPTRRRRKSVQPSKRKNSDAASLAADRKVDVGTAVKPTKQTSTRIFAYPTTQVPSKALLQDLVQNAVQEEVSDQANLYSAGIMSLEQVILPAIAHEEEQALKKLQSKVQRDARHHASVVQKCRQVVRQSLLAAIAAAQAERMQRLKRQNQQRKEQRLQQAQERLQQIRQEYQTKLQQVKKQAKELYKEELQDERKQQKRHYLPNQNLWKEIVLLTRSQTQLEKEEKMWTRAKQSLASSVSSAATETEDDTATTASATVTSKSHWQETTESTIQEIVLASSRIQKGLQQVLNILQASEDTRVQLYQEYKEHHQFQGYPGMSQPKQLLRLLSQDA